MESLDRILSSQLIVAEDLVASGKWKQERSQGAEASSVPVVSHASALFEPNIRPGAVQMLLELPPGWLDAMRRRTVPARRAWQRFVAVRAAAAETLPMEPVLQPDALVLIDRHYNSLLPYRPTHPNLYAVRQGSQLLLRYVDFTANRLVLRPHNLVYPVDLIEVEPGESPGDRITGRVVLILNEF